MIFDIEEISKITQTLFYIVGGTLATLTFLSARNGLLNTVNTEYYKKVLDNVQQISNSIAEEFDIANRESSPGGIEELLDRIEAEVIDDVDAERPGRDVGTPLVKEIIKFRDLATKYETDPFLPEPIRQAIFRYCEDRWKNTIEAHQEIAPIYREKFWNHVHRGEEEPSRGSYHNRIIDRLYQTNVGPGQLKDRAHEIR